MDNSFDTPSGSSDGSKNNWLPWSLAGCLGLVSACLILTLIGGGIWYVNQPKAQAVAPIATQVVAPAATQATAATQAPTTWKQVQVALYADGVEVDGQLWELPLGTHMAVSRANGRYEAIPSAPAGVVNGVDHGWCADDQFDCPPHALLVNVEVPESKVACLSVQMDISWRLMVQNSCGESVPMRVSLRYNDQTRTAAELATDYLALAGLKQQVQNATSEVGLFLSVKNTGADELDYLDKVIPFGFSCWDCLADTQGIDGQPVRLDDGNFSTFGPDTAPSGSSLLPGVVFPLPRPTDKPYQLDFGLTVTTDTVVWVGRYDVRPLSGSTPTATPKP